MDMEYLKKQTKKAFSFGFCEGWVKDFLYHANHRTNKLKLLVRFVTGDKQMLDYKLDSIWLKDKKALKHFASVYVRDYVRIYIMGVVAPKVDFKRFKNAHDEFRKETAYLDYGSIFGE
jgi:hypothetical protein